MQIVADLKTLRSLANYMLRFDAVTFFSYLETLRSTEGANSVWLFHSGAVGAVTVWVCMGDPTGLVQPFTLPSLQDRRSPARSSAASTGILRPSPNVPRSRSLATRSPRRPAAAHTVFEAAKARVYEAHRGLAPAKRKQGVADPAPAGAGASGGSIRIEPVLEPLPKWGLLQDILEEIGEEELDAGEAFDPRHGVVVACDDLFTATQVGPSVRGTPGARGRRTVAPCGGLGVARAPPHLSHTPKPSRLQLREVLSLGAEGHMRRVWEDYLIRRAASAAAPTTDPTTHSPGPGWGPGRPGSRWASGGARFSVSEHAHCTRRA